MTTLRSPAAPQRTPDPGLRKSAPLIRLRLLVVVIGLVTACSAGDAKVGRPQGSVVEAAIPVEELIVDTGEVKLRVRVVGPTDANATVVTVHGGPGLSLEAMTVFEGLAGAGQRVVGYDQRGAGRSTSPADGDFGLDAQVADLEAVRLALGADTVQLIGESWGGAIAAAYAAAHPGHVTDLVLIGAIPLDREEFRAGQRRFQERVTELQRMGVIPDPLPQNSGGSCLAVFEAFLPAYLADPQSHPEIAIESCTAATSRATYEAFVADGSVEKVAPEIDAASRLVHVEAGLEKIDSARGRHLSGETVRLKVAP